MARMRGKRACATTWDEPKRVTVGERLESDILRVGRIKLPAPSGAFQAASNEIRLQTFEKTIKELQHEVGHLRQELGAQHERILDLENNPGEGKGK